jgi:ABC-2 type transport system permease protein
LKLFLHCDVEPVNGTGGTLNNVLFNGWSTAATYCAVGIVFTLLAILIYKYRRMETASDIVAVPILKPIFKYCMAIGVSLVFSFILTGILFEYNGVSYIWLAVFLLLGGVIGYFAAEMLLQKSFKVFRRWKGFLVYSLIVIVLVIGINFDIFGFEKYVPETNQVEWIELSTSYSGTVEISDSSQIEDFTHVHQAIIDDKALNTDGNMSNYSAAGPNLDTSDDYVNDSYKMNVYISYHLKDSKTIIRQYSLYISTETMADNHNSARILEDFLNESDIKILRMSAPKDITKYSSVGCTVEWWDAENEEQDSITLDAAAATDLYNNCLLPDIRDTNLGEIDFLGSRTDVYNCQVYFDFYTDNSESGYADVDYYYYVPCTSSTRTNTFLQSLGVPLN